MEQSGTITKERIEQWTNRWHSKLQNIVPINLDGTTWSGTTFFRNGTKNSSKFRNYFPNFEATLEVLQPCCRVSLIPPPNSSHLLLVLEQKQDLAALRTEKNIYLFQNNTSHVFSCTYVLNILREKYFFLIYIMYIWYAQSKNRIVKKDCACQRL